MSTDHNLWRERRAEADSNRGPSAYQPNALPQCQTGSRELLWSTRGVYMPAQWAWTQAYIDVVIRSVHVINPSTVKNASNKTQSTNWRMAGCTLKEGVNANLIAEQLQLCVFFFLFFLWIEVKAMFYFIFSLLILILFWIGDVRHVCLWCLV